MGTLDYEKISRYIDGEMTGDELAAFEQLIRQDNDLKREVEQYKEVNDTLKTNLHPDKDELDFRHTLEGFQQEYFKRGTKVIHINKYRKWIAAVAAAAIIVMMLTWWPWKDDLYQEFASTKMAGVAMRGTKSDSLLQKATENFNRKEYAEAVPLLEALNQLEPENTYTRFYYAIALLESNKIERSREELNKLYEGTSLFRYDAAFYIALGYLREKNEATCKKWLLKIPPDADIYSKAQSLLKRL
jgi:negative regulator of sigma E activity